MAALPIRKREVENSSSNLIFRCNAFDDECSSFHEPLLPPPSSSSSQPQIEQKQQQQSRPYIDMILLQKFKTCSILLGFLTGFFAECSALGAHVTAISLWGTTKNYEAAVISSTSASQTQIFFLAVPWSLLTSLMSIAIFGFVQSLVMVVFDNNSGVSCANCSCGNHDGITVSSSSSASSSISSDEDDGGLVEELVWLKSSVDNDDNITVITISSSSSSPHAVVSASDDNENVLDELLWHMEYRFGGGTLLGMGFASAFTDIVLGLKGHLIYSLSIYILALFWVTILSLWRTSVKYCFRNPHRRNQSAKQLSFNE